MYRRKIILYGTRKLNIEKVAEHRPKYLCHNIHCPRVY
nr:MAG TPA: hypothetical protein [Caudoviricetes sp.]DAY92732.1 MAG TPA: hypothetical protein [Caudoviricetes sp.]